MSHITNILPSSNVSDSLDYLYITLVDMFRQIDGMTEVEVSIPYLDSIIESSAREYTVFKYKDYGFYFTIYGSPTQARPTSTTTTSYTHVYVFGEDNANNTSSTYACMIACQDYYMYANTPIYICPLPNMLIIKFYSGSGNNIMVVWKEGGKSLFGYVTYSTSSNNSSLSVPNPVYTTKKETLNTQTITVYDYSNNNRGLIFPVVWCVPSSDYNMYSTILKQCYSELIRGTSPLAKLTINGADYIHVCGSWIIPYTESTSS